MEFQRSIGEAGRSPSHHISASQQSITWF